MDCGGNEGEARLEALVRDTGHSGGGSLELA